MRAAPSGGKETLVSKSSWLEENQGAALGHLGVDAPLLAPWTRFYERGRRYVLMTYEVVNRTAALSLSIYHSVAAAPCGPHPCLKLLGQLPRPLGGGA